MSASIGGAGVGAIIGRASSSDRHAQQYGPPSALIPSWRGDLRIAGLCYAEMASAVPISGSAYTYAYATLGELAAWIIGWDLILEYAVGAITVALGWSGYVVSLASDFGLHLPTQFVSSPLDYDSARRAWAFTGAVLNLPAALVVIVVTSLLVVGIRETARFNNWIVAIKLMVIALFIICAAPAFITANWITPGNPAGTFIPPNAAFGTYGWSVSLRRGRGFFAYIGFDAVSVAAQEAKIRCGICRSAFSAR
jgi:APA family basic amino acid/polyamine antiporter